MPSIIVPVGFDNGPRYPADPSETFHYEILSNDESVEVPEESYHLWALAFPDVESHQGLTFTRAKLATLAANGPDDISGAHDIIDQLVRAQLLAEYEPDTPGALKFLEQHRLAPLAVGMGSTKEDPSTFRIGRGGQVILEMSSDTFSLWTLCISAPSIWHAVKELAGDPPDEPEEDINLGYMFASVIPVLVSLELAFLQPA
jgi:hypothetical protein